MSNNLTLSDIELNIDKYAGNNLEEIILTHPAIDCKFLLNYKNKINFNKLSNIYNTDKIKGKLKPCSIELNKMCIREFDINLEKN
jgi:hypothetical protein